MNRREKLLMSTLGKNWEPAQEKMLDTTIKIILGDMGDKYTRFWDSMGPGVLCFQPEQDNNVFYMTLEELHNAVNQCEKDDNKELAETFQSILDAAGKIDPTEMAGYVINDKNGIRYFQIEYNKALESNLAS